MFLKFLEKIGRKKLLLDRGKSHPEYHKAKPWMNRYFLLFRNRPKWFPFNIIIHELLDDDHGDGVHSHMCPYITIILKSSRNHVNFICKSCRNHVKTYKHHATII